MSTRQQAISKDFLREVSLFDGMTDNQLSQLFKIGKVLNFKVGDIILREGQEGGNLFIIIDGRAEVVKAGKEPTAKPKYLADLSRGSVFGEMSVFDDAPCSASIKALSECAVHVIKGEDFKRFLKKNPEIAYSVFCTLIMQFSSRLRRTNLALTLLDFGSQ
jgi:CRP-like cAMP-binding protein